MAVELYDEHEQGERVRNWIKEYGFSIVMGLVLAFGGIFGFQQWRSHQATQSELAAEYFEVIQSELEGGDTEFALEQYEVLRETAANSAYVGLAGLLVASAHVENSRLEAAADIYRDMLGQKRLADLWPVTRLRLARVMDAQGERAQALELLAGEPPVGFEAAWAELRGDLLMAMDEPDEARLAYQEALEHLSGEFGAGRMIQLKIDATGPGLSEDAS
jgi:predicted negative regulator of RcsB-dependent stress response